MPRFDMKGIVVNINTGEEFFIQAWRFHNNRMGISEELDLLSCKSGVSITVVGTALDDFISKADFAKQRSDHFTDSLRYIVYRGILPSIDSAPIHMGIDLAKVPECSHDWVTWTGLFGETTDCSKCKVKK